LSGIYLRSGQPRKAVTVAEAVVKRGPNVATHHNLLGIARGSAGDAAGARTAFERALKLEPGLTPAKLNLARLDIDAKAYDKAELRLKQLVADNDRNVAAHLSLAVIADQRGKPADVLRALEKARDVEGHKQVKAALMLVDYHMRHRRPAEALEAAKRAFSKAPEDFNVLMTYARIRLANNDPGGAALTLKDATRVAEFTPERLTAAALLQLQTPDLAGVQYSLEKALSSRPNFLPALAVMTEVELRQGDPVKAERRARLILESNPKLAIGHSLLGDIAVAREQPFAAIEAYRKAYQVEPSSETLLRLFNALSRQGDTRGALPLAEQWLKVKPDDDGVRRALADGYARSANYLAAKIAYEKLLSKNAEDTAVLNNLANVYIRLSDPKAAVLTARKAMEKDSGNAAVLDTLGWALFLSKQGEGALQYLRDARLRDPLNSEIRYHLGAVLISLGRKSEAAEELEAALRSGPVADWTGEARRSLQSMK
jgi:putative PEP-CTERM system TPR-repeat lipoprotein